MFDCPEEWAVAPPRNTSLRYPGGRSARWGGIGFLAVYAIVAPVAALRRDALLSDVVVDLGAGVGAGAITEFFDPGQLADWQVAGLIAYNGHLAPVDVPVGLAEGRSSNVESVNLVLEAGGPYLLLLFVPALAYVATGFLATRRRQAKTGTGRRYGGAMQCFGTLPLSLVGLLLFGFSAHAGSAGPSLLWGPVLVGLVYPAAFGAVGGTIANRVYGVESERLRRDDGTGERGWG